MANRYDARYDFRIADINDTDAIMKFIHDEWSAGHILAHDRDLFLWQYGCSEYGDNNRINVVLMTEKDGTISGMIGFIPYSQDKEHLHISTAITKVRAENALPMAGLELMRRQKALVGEKANFASGANPGTILPLFEKVFHHRTGVMQQYYMLNTAADFKIADPDLASYDPSYGTYPYKLEEITDFDALASRYDLCRINEHMSVKSPEFIKKRYFLHPYYMYRKWLITDESGDSTGVLFGREIEAEGSKALRLVDYRGSLENLEKTGAPLHELMEHEGYEYIDLMVSDLSAYDMKKAGMNLLDPDGNTVIPHYFEPFVRQNVRNWYQNDSDIVIFKADGDQDRPNRWKGN